MCWLSIWFAKFVVVNFLLWLLGDGADEGGYGFVKVDPKLVGERENEINKIFEMKYYFIRIEV